MVDAERNDATKDHKNGRDAGAKLSEPSEVDPCIEEKPHRNKFIENLETAARKKTGLSRDGVRYAGAVLLLTFVLLVIVIALAIAWPSVPHHYQFPVCETPACLRASAQIQDSLNASASPCDDVWTWACGNWLARNSLPADKGIWNQKQQLAKHEATLVRDLITTLPLPLHTGTLEWKLMHFYEACMDVDTIEIDKERPLANIISELGGWRIMKNWNMADHDGTSLLINLQVKYGITPWTKISVEPHPNSPGSSIIKISPSSLGLPDKTYYFNSRNDDAIEKAYVQFISDVVINFSATKEEADRFGRTLYNYEKRIAEIKPDSSQFQDPIQTCHLITIRELSETVPQLAIGDIVAKMYPDATIDYSTEVIVTSPAYLSEVARIITSSAKETINDYYIWTLVREYLPYLNNKFAASWNAFNKEIFGINKPPERWEFCVNLVQKFMGLAVEVLLDKRNPITNGTRRAVNDVYESIRLTVHKRLTKYKSKLNLHKHIVTKINTLQLEIGLPRNISTDEYVKNFYKKLNVIKKSFFHNYKHGVTFLKKIEERRLTLNVVDDYLLSYIYSKPSYVYYSPSENKIVIPNILLSNFYFEDRYPWSVIFGRLGVEIAEAMVSSILPYDNVWTAEHRLLTEFHSAVTESISVIKKPQTCLKDFMLKYHQVDETIANLTTLNVVKTISALQIAEEALNDFIIASKLHVHQPSFEEMEDSGLFYLTYSQTLCSITADQYKMYDGIRNYKFPHKALLFTLWFQVPSFSSAFSCPAIPIAPCSDIF